MSRYYRLMIAIAAAVALGAMAALGGGDAEAASGDSTWTFAADCERTLNAYVAQGGDRRDYIQCELSSTVDSAGHNVVSIIVQDVEGVCHWFDTHGLRHPDAPSHPDCEEPVVEVAPVAQMVTWLAVITDPNCAPVIEAGGRPACWHYAGWVAH